jgi:hypothetical protein
VAFTLGDRHSRPERFLQVLRRLLHGAVGFGDPAAVGMAEKRGDGEMVGPVFEQPLAEAVPEIIGGKPLHGLAGQPVKLLASPPLEELAMAQATGQPYDLSFGVAWSGRQKKRPWWLRFW